MSDLLLNSFFSITQLDYNEDSPDKLHALLELNPAHDIFKGHFPGNPVVPGVCILQMIKETLSQHFDKELIMVKGDEVKFLNIINPLVNQKIEIEFKIKHPGDEMVHISAVISHEDQMFMKFRGVFR
jgi:3-hydroxyacyl-[acyl-carrier-protein] dehydratase